MNNLTKIRNFLKFIILFVGIGVATTLWAASTKEKVVLVGITPSYPPFEYHDKDQIIGFDVDLIHAIAKELNWKIQFKALGFHDLIPELKSHKIDLAISAINMIPERNKEIDFSTAYYQPHSLVWVYLGQHQFSDKSSASMKVGVQKGTHMEKWMHDQQKDKKHIQVVSYPSTPILFEKLNNKEVDTIVVEEIQAIQFNQGHPSLITYHPTGTTIEGYGIAFAKGSSLTSQVNTALQKLEKAGFLQELQSKWIKPQSK